jgi:hypothetical protein
MKMWGGFIQLRVGSGGGFCEHCKGREFLDQLNVYFLRAIPFHEVGASLGIERKIIEAGYVLGTIT